MVTSSYRLAAAPEFEKYEHAAGFGLKLMRKLDARGLDAIYQIAEGPEGQMMEHKLKSATATVSDQGTFAALVATWNEDREGDVIARGAFTATISRWRLSGKRLPLMWNHQSGVAGITPRWRCVEAEWEVRSWLERLAPTAPRLRGPPTDSRRASNGRSTRP